MTMSFFKNIVKTFDFKRKNSGIPIMFEPDKRAGVLLVGSSIPFQNFYYHTWFKGWREKTVSPLSRSSKIFTMMTIFLQIPKIYGEMRRNHWIKFYWLEKTRRLPANKFPSPDLHYYFFKSPLYLESFRGTWRNQRISSKTKKMVKVRVKLKSSGPK